MAKIFDYFKNKIKKIKKGDVEPINISFFNKHKFTMMWIVAFCFIYISTKYANLLEKEEILELKQQLQSARTESVRASAEYKTQVRESRVKSLADSMHLRLTVPEQPAFKLTGK